MVLADNPIRVAEDDLLGRNDLATVFAREVLSLDVQEGACVGILGPWGSGKTSFINLARTPLAEAGATIIDINPWMFSGADQLVGAFFSELVAQLRVKRSFWDIAERIEDYGEAFSGLTHVPLIGLLHAISKLLGKLRRNRKAIGDLRARVKESLLALKHPVVVVLDDIDRLSCAEIRDVFKLVRLTASFPNVIYIVAFDRAQVEKALEEQGVPGRQYLEKVLQVAVDLPLAPPHVLHTQLIRAIDEAMVGVADTGPFHEQTWPDIYAEIIRPLVGNMRDVRRYAASIRGTVQSLGGQVALADALALEAIRIFMPDVFDLLDATTEGLTTTSPAVGGRHDPPHLKPMVDSLIAAANEHEDVLRAAIRRLFPAAERHVGGSHYGPEWKAEWLRNRRVAHEDILRFYLERVAGRGLQAFTRAEKAWTLMTDRQALQDFLSSLDPSLMQDVLSSLEVFEREFSEDHTVPGCIAILNVLHLLSDQQRGMFELPPHFAASRVVYRLLRRLPPAVVEKAVRDILPEVTSLAAKLMIITVVGYRENAGHKLVSEDAASEFERAWRADVRARAASASALASEPDLLRVLLLAKNEAEQDEPQLVIPEETSLTLAIFRASVTKAFIQSLGSRAVRTVSRLEWDALVDLFGGEQAVENRFLSLKTCHTEADAELLELVQKYLDGWRPKEFEDD